MPDKNLLSPEKETTVSDSQVISKINTCIAILGGESDLLAVIGSFKSTLSNNEVFSSLDEWITTALNQRQAEFKELLEYSNR